MGRLDDSEIEQRLQGSDWNRDGDKIVRDLKFDDFAAAMKYVNRVADLAEERNHHPDILVHGWNNVRLTLYTHTEGGVTDGDFAMAEAIDALS